MYTSAMAVKTDHSCKGQGNICIGLPGSLCVKRTQSRGAPVLSSPNDEFQTTNSIIPVTFRTETDELLMFWAFVNSQPPLFMEIILHRHYLQTVQVAQSELKYFSYCCLTWSFPPVMTRIHFQRQCSSSPPGLEVTPSNHVAISFNYHPCNTTKTLTRYTNHKLQYSFPRTRIPLIHPFL